METLCWESEVPHFNNSDTMDDFIENINTSLEITFIDGSYAEGIDKHGFAHEIHAGGNGDAFHHKITLKKLDRL